MGVRIGDSNLIGIEDVDEGDHIDRILTDVSRDGGDGLETLRDIMGEIE